WNLRRTRRRAELGDVLLPGGYGLRLLFTVPRADCPPGRRAGRYRRRQAGSEAHGLTRTRPQLVQNVTSTLRGTVTTVPFSTSTKAGSSPWQHQVSHAARKFSRRFAVRTAAIPKPNMDVPGRGRAWQPSATSPTSAFVAATSSVPRCAEPHNIMGA